MALENRVDFRVKNQYEGGWTRMKTLLLSGYGISLSVDSGCLHVRDGRDQNKEPLEYVFRPKFIDTDNIVIYGHSGNITLDSMKWLSKMNVQLTIINWDGRVLSNVLIPEMKQAATRMAQYKAYENGLQVTIAKKFIEAKIQNTNILLDWLIERYPELREDKTSQLEEIERFQSSLGMATTVGQIRGYEGMVARNYWDIVSSLFDDYFGFEGRNYGKTGRPMGAVDPINALFNYGYTFLESLCWKAVNANGLDPHVGFLHEMASGKAPLVYDLQEPFRWIVDQAVITALENKVFDKKDFIRTENYNIRIRPQGVEKLLNEVNSMFTSKMKYGKKNWEWAYIIERKTNELANYLAGKRKILDMSKPTPKIDRIDNAEMREKILKMSYSEWKKTGFSKGTLHYLKKNAEDDKPFIVYGKVIEKLKDFY
jgi:CRISP-associated protein Cas1